MKIKNLREVFTKNYGRNASASQENANNIRPLRQEVQFSKTSIRKQFNRKVIEFTFLPYASELLLKNMEPVLYKNYQHLIEVSANHLNLTYSPLFHRYYVASFFGGIFHTAALGAFYLKDKSAAFTALTSLGLFTLYESYQSMAPNRSFDKGDMTAYILGLTLYVAASKIYIKAKTSNTLTYNIDEPK